MSLSLSINSHLCVLLLSGPFLSKTVFLLTLIYTHESLFQHDGTPASIVHGGSSRDAIVQLTTPPGFRGNHIFSSGDTVVVTVDMRTPEQSTLQFHVNGFALKRVRFIEDLRIPLEQIMDGFRFEWCVFVCVRVCVCILTLVFDRASVSLYNEGAEMTLEDFSEVSCVPGMRASGGGSSSHTQVEDDRYD